jgi:type III secretory pathway lipoprotein EscJ
MKNIIPFILLILTACNTLPQLYKSVEDMETNDAIDISISKEVVDTEKNLNITIELNESREK